MEIIATRQLALHTDGAVEAVLVNIGRPIQAPAGGWRCEFDIAWSQDDVDSRYAMGVDGIQAIGLALRLIGEILKLSPEAQEGRLRFGLGTDLGFPDFQLQRSDHNGDGS